MGVCCWMARTLVARPADKLDSVPYGRMAFQNVPPNLSSFNTWQNRKYTSLYCSTCCHLAAQSPISYEIQTSSLVCYVYVFVVPLISYNYSLGRFARRKRHFVPSGRAVLVSKCTKMRPVCVRVVSVLVRRPRVSERSWFAYCFCSRYHKSVGERRKNGRPLH